MLRRLIFLCLILFVSVPLFAQGGQTTVKFVDFNFDMDSTTYGSYTEKKIVFDRGADFNDDEYFTAGYYNLDVYIDSTSWHKTDTDSVTLGDTDSLFIYIKKHVKGQNTAVSNDSTFLTSNSSTTGFDFALKTWYHFEFDLSATSGYSIFYKRNCDLGAFNIRCIASK